MCEICRKFVETQSGATLCSGMGGTLHSTPCVGGLQQIRSGGKYAYGKQKIRYEIALDNIGPPTVFVVALCEVFKNLHKIYIYNFFPKSESMQIDFPWLLTNVNINLSLQWKYFVTLSLKADQGILTILSNELFTKIWKPCCCFYP